MVLPLSRIRKEEIIEEALCECQMTNEPRQPSIYHEYTGYEINIDITTLKEMLRDKKISRKIMLNETSSDHIIIELELDTSTNRR